MSTTCLLLGMYFSVNTLFPIWSLIKCTSISMCFVMPWKNWTFSQYNGAHVVAQNQLQFDILALEAVISTRLFLKPHVTVLCIQPLCWTLPLSSVFLHSTRLSCRLDIHSTFLQTLHHPCQQPNWHLQMLPTLILFQQYSIGHNSLKYLKILLHPCQCLHIPVEFVDTEWDFWSGQCAYCNVSTTLL